MTIKRRRWTRPRDEKLLRQYRGVKPCWWCGRSLFCQAAHLATRGMGGWQRADVPLNLASLCAECHQQSHYGLRPLLADLIAVVAARNGVQQADVEEAIREIKWGK